MFRVLIWDYTGESKKWCERNFEKTGFEIIHTITPEELIPDILLQKDAWDVLLIFERNMRKNFDVTIRALKLPLEKVIYALEDRSWLRCPNVVYTLLNDSGGGIIRRSLNFENDRKRHDFIACTAEGLSYVATSQDKYIIRGMYIKGVNHANKNMNTFHSLAQKYYNVDDSAGYFLDLGANIGTTGIYFCKKITPNLKLLSFEPSLKNFNLHRINLILNNLESKATLVKCGLGNKADKLTIYESLTNPGHNNFTEPNDNAPSETVDVITLDSYLAENKISASSVKYIWIDTEGFEPQVLLGAKNLIKENSAPIFMECNLAAWDRLGLFEEMMALLMEHYSHFILIKGRNETLYPIKALQTIDRPNSLLGQIGDIFLIKKGAID